jgi:phosphomannomutase
MARSGKKCSEIRKEYPEYYISKNKIELKDGLNPDDVLVKMKEHFANEKINTIDGLKIDFEGQWVHLRKSNTEPIIRIYAESKTPDSASELANRVMMLIKSI